MYRSISACNLEIGSECGHALRAHAQGRGSFNSKVSGAYQVRVINNDKVMNEGVRSTRDGLHR